MIVKTYQELQKEVNKRMSKALNEIIKKIYTQLLEFIEKDIYGTYSPQMYERTYDFKLRAWAYNTAKQIGDSIQIQIKYTPEKMRLNPEKSQHGIYSNNEELQGFLGANKVIEDNRGMLASILNAGETARGGGWNYGRPSVGDDFVPTKPFWDDTINWVEQNLRQLVIEKFRQNGLDIK